MEEHAYEKKAFRIVKLHKVRSFPKKTKFNYTEAFEYMKI